MQPGCRLEHYRGETDGEWSCDLHWRRGMVWRILLAFHFVSNAILMIMSYWRRVQLQLKAVVSAVKFLFCVILLEHVNNELWCWKLCYQRLVLVCTIQYLVLFFFKTAIFLLILLSRLPKLPSQCCLNLPGNLGSVVWAAIKKYRMSWYKQAYQDAIRAFIWSYNLKSEK